MDDNLNLDYVNILIENIEKGIKGTFDQFVLPIAGGIIVLVIIYGGIQYITGGVKGAENAKKTIIAAVIGAVIIALSAVILNLVASWIHPVWQNINSIHKQSML